MPGSLHRAAERGDVDECRRLLRAGARVDALLECKESFYGFENVKRRTSLHFAAQNGHTHVVWLLVENGANVDAEDEIGWCPIHYAADRHFVSIIAHLALHGADVNKQAGSSGVTPLHVGVCFHNELTCADEKYEIAEDVDDLEMLLLFGARTELRDRCGRTPLEKAHYFSMPLPVRLLLDVNADATNLRPDAANNHDRYGIREHLNKTVFSTIPSLLRCYELSLCYSLLQDEQREQTKIETYSRISKQLCVRLMVS
jgi:ankyrin repeat protein